MNSTDFVVRADLSQPDQAADVLRLLDGYSQDSMGDGAPLSDAARREVIPGLRQHPTTLVFLAYHGAEAVGLAICFRGFSTFSARPLINLHDFFVVPAFRARGFGRLLMTAIENHGRELGCCRLTLEVQENNLRARGIYEAAGFRPMLYVPEAGISLNYSRELE